MEEIQPAKGELGHARENGFGGAGGIFFVRLDLATGGVSGPGPLFEPPRPRSPLAPITLGLTWAPPIIARFGSNGGV